MGELLIPRGGVRRGAAGSWILGLGIFLFGLLMILPFVFMVSASFKPQAMITTEPLKWIPDSLYLENYRQALAYPGFFRWYLNSIWICAATIAIRALVVTMAAYAFARMDIPGKELVFVALFSSWMIPTDTTLVARYLVIKGLGLYGSPWAVILSFSFDVFMLFMMRQFFMKIPFDLTEAAVVDGCSHVAIYLRIILPLVKPALATMSLFTFIWTWNSFMEPYIFIGTLKNQTLTVGLQYFQNKGGVDLGMMLAGATMGTLPVIVLFSLSQRYFIQGIAQSGIKG
jgi:ABC-type sugar transport system, permease component